MRKKKISILQGHPWQSVLKASVWVHSTSTADTSAWHSKQVLRMLLWLLISDSDLYHVTRVVCQTLTAE